MDGCGHVSAVVSREFAVDSTPPTVSWTAPAVITSSPLQLTGSTVDPLPAGALVQRVDMQLDSEASAWLGVAGPYAPQGGVQGWVWTWNTPSEDGVAHQVRARAIDGVGNVTIETPWQATIVDNVAPATAVTARLESVVLPNDAGVSGLAPTLLISGTATDGSGVASVGIRVYDPLGGSWLAPAALTAGAWEWAPELAGWAAGRYALRVEAVDIHGNTGLLGPFTLDVLDAPITGLAASNDGPRRATETITLTATITAGSNVVYAWDFGDGATGAGAVATHVYAVEGLYNAVVTASNSATTLTASTAVTVLPRLEVEAGADQTVNEGETAAIVAAFTDANALATHTASIDWGDGSQSAGVVDEAAHTIAGSHVYGDNGVYTVTVTVSAPGVTPASDTLQMTVLNVAPTATLGSDSPALEGEAVTVSFSNVVDVPADTLTYSFDWDNDGVYDVVDQAEPTAAYTWPDDGYYTVTGRVQDDDGGWNAYTITVHVLNVAPAVSVEPGFQTVKRGEAIAAIRFSARDVPADPLEVAWSWSAEGTWFEGMMPGLSVAPDPANRALELAETGWTVTGMAILPAGMYALRATVSDDDGGVTRQDAVLVIELETADLAIIKVGQPDGQVLAGEELEYTVYVYNLGPSEAANVVVLDDIVSREGLTIVSASWLETDGATAFEAIYDDGADQARFTLDRLEAGSRAVYQVVVTADIAVDVNNLVRVTSDTPDPDQSNNFDDTMHAFLAVADLRLTKNLVGGGAPVAGTEITFQYDVENLGPSEASNVVLREQIPAGLTFVSSAGPDCALEGNVLTCVYGNIPAGATRSGLELTFAIDPAYEPGATLLNTAEVASDVLDPNRRNNVSAWAGTVEAQADLELRKFAVGAPVAGEVIHYELQVDALGPSRALDVWVRDFLPSGVELVSASVDLGEGACSLAPATNALFCDLGDLDPGAHVMIIVGVRIASSVAAGAVLNNSADVHGLHDPNSANNTAAAEVTVRRVAAVVVSKESSPNPVVAGERLTYQVTVTNQGPSDATDVRVNDVLPAGVTFVAMADNGQWAEVVPGSGVGAAHAARRAERGVQPRGADGSQSCTSPRWPMLSRRCWWSTRSAWRRLRARRPARKRTPTSPRAPTCWSRRWGRRTRRCWRARSWPTPSRCTTWARLTRARCACWTTSSTPCRRELRTADGRAGADPGAGRHLGVCVGRDPRRRAARGLAGARG